MGRRQTDRERDREKKDREPVRMFQSFTRIQKNFFKLFNPQPTDFLENEAAISVAVCGEAAAGGNVVSDLSL